jgi:hypothetical protein
MSAGAWQILSSTLNQTDKPSARRLKSEAP